MDQPFHAGELAAQARAGLHAPGMTGIRPFMPDQHRDFFALLPYLFVATVDAAGWPIATVLTGEPGFISSPDPTTLVVAAAPRAGEPGHQQFRAGRPFGALGLDFATRRRNRANGVIEAADAGGLRLKVLQSFGNCPQYIQTRAVETAPASMVPAETVAIDAPEVLAQIADADTFFVATVSGSALNGGRRHLASRRPAGLRQDRGRRTGRAGLPGQPVHEHLGQPGRGSARGLAVR
ncbi:pyridoxamine 5'-phosphate oxidase family protein [Caulobacter segnis]